MVKESAAAEFWTITPANVKADIVTLPAENKAGRPKKQISPAVAVEAAA